MLLCLHITWGGHGTVSAFAGGSPPEVHLLRAVGVSEHLLEESGGLAGVALRAASFSGLLASPAPRGSINLS